MKFASSVLLMLALTPVASEAQTLGDVAREQRNVRTEAPGSEGTINTETAALPRPGASLSVAGTRAVTPAPQAEASDPAVQAPDEAPPAEVDPVDAGEPEPVPEVADAEPTPPQTEEAWRERFDQARAEITRTEERLALLELELGELNGQLLTRSDIYNREYQILPQITAKEQEILDTRLHLNDSHLVLSELRNDLRRGGFPAGWAR